MNSHRRLTLLFMVCAVTVGGRGFALGRQRYVDYTPQRGSFALVQNGAAPLYVDSSDYPGVARAVHDLQADIGRVSGIKPSITRGKPRGREVVLIGTLGKSALIDRLVRRHKLEVQRIAGKWESYLVAVVPRPLPGVSSALVIAGSDKRGTIFGIYDLSEQIGVSPWYWWADVPVQHHAALYIRAGQYVQGEPGVRYRGIFLNDEAPALTNWVKEKFGGYNHQFYEKVFELLLRLRANYLWPAMWDNAFNEDDPLNPKLADEYGIVMGTSHHEPMLRAQQEWKRHGQGAWDYSTNAGVLRQFWTEGVERNKNYESIVTLGMRGDGDLPMTESANIELLQNIVADQRKTLAERVRPDLASIPQDWALYKEVQEYYEKGMRVPDDVTLLWCDDNWGNIRRLPTPQERARRGGAGVYYHFDYVGGPRSYKWLNTVPITKVWEQMNLAWEYDARRIWIVNVGDLKPMEFPIEYFLTLAWDLPRWPAERIPEYTRLWAEREFGPELAPEIAEIVSKYTKYNGRRKPELLQPETFSLLHYQEADRVLADWKKLVEQAESLQQRVPEAARDAYFQLVLHPVKASALVAELYITAGRNHLYAKQGRAATNDLADRVRHLFRADAELTEYYHRTLAHGKWNHMMDQTHIGYTYWNQPPRNAMPAVSELLLPVAAEMGVAVEGSDSFWPGALETATLPQMDAYNRPRRFIDVYNKGQTPFSFTATADIPWIRLSATQGTVDQEQRLWVSVDWENAPSGLHQGEIRITGPGVRPEGIIVKVDVSRPEIPSTGALQGFIESGGYVAIEAEHYTRKRDTEAGRWERIADYGRTLSSMTVFPVTAPSVLMPAAAPVLEYDMYLFHAGKIDVETVLAPTQGFVPGRGLRYAIAFDDQPPQVVDTLAHNAPADWETAVKDSVRKVRSTHTVATPGRHTLHIWMVDPAVVLQRLVVDLGGVKPSYLGPPESYQAR